MIEPRVATGKDGPEAQRNAVYMSASPDEAALYALVRPAVGRRGGWAIRGGNVHYVEDPRIPLNTEGYVYHADIPDGQYRQPPQTNPQIGYTVDSAVAPQGKTRVTLDDHRRRFISYPDKDALRSALAGMTTDQEKMAEVATKKDPTLWQEAKRDAVRRMDGVHSARAMQLASKLYKERGGTYAGKKPAPSQNSLRTWTKQKWKWSDGDRPGQGGEGVYLPSKSVSALKSTASGREKLRQAREVKEDATSRGQQFSQHGLHIGKQRDKTAALSPQRYEEITPRSRASALLVEDPMNNTSRHIKTAALRAFLASNTKLAAVRHTLITGHSGAGKTTLARSFGLPIHSLDDDPDIRAQLEFQKQYREQNDGRLPVGGEYAVRMRAAEQAAIRRALALRAPHAIEGSYLLNTAPTDYPTHALHLVDVDPELAVRQRVERQRIKDLAKGRGWGPERAAGVAMRGRQLVEEYEPGAMRWRNDPNVVKHKRSDTDKIASIYADRSTQTMFNESASGLEGRMVLRQLDEVCNMAQELMQVIPEDADVPEWVQNHVATINDRLKSVHSYVVYEMKRSGPSMDSAGMIQQAQQLAPDMSEMSSDPHEMDELQAKTSAYRAAMWQAFNRTLYGR